MLLMLHQKCRTTEYQLIEQVLNSIHMTHINTIHFTALALPFAVTTMIARIMDSPSTLRVANYHKSMHKYT